MQGQFVSIGYYLQKDLEHVDCVGFTESFESVNNISNATVTVCEIDEEGFTFEVALDCEDTNISSVEGVGYICNRIDSFVAKWIAEHTEHATVDGILAKLSGVEAEFIGYSERWDELQVEARGE